jgi:hypothetical protein
MPGLRERVIAAICEEWPNPDNEVNSATIYERLKNDEMGPLQALVPTRWSPN